VRNAAPPDGNASPHCPAFSARFANRRKKHFGGVFCKGFDISTLRQQAPDAAAPAHALHNSRRRSKIITQAGMAFAE
jgi:hypothetical protein